MAVVPAARRPQPPAAELLALSDAEQVDDFHAAVEALSAAWTAWRGQPGFRAEDDVPPRRFAPEPSRYRKPKPPTKGELIARAADELSAQDVTVAAAIDAVHPLFGLWWNDFGPALPVAEQVEQLRWLWLRARNITDARYENEHGKPAWLHRDRPG